MAGSNYAKEAANSGMYSEKWARIGQFTRREMPAGVARPPLDG